MKESNPLDVLSDARRLEALQKTGLLDSPPEETFDRLTALACEILGVPISLVSLVDKDRQFFKSSQGLPEPWAGLREIPLSHSFCQHVVTSNERLVINDARENPLARDNFGVRELGVLAHVGIPLSAPDGQVLGSFCAIDFKPRQWSERELRIMSVLADHATAEIAARWRFREMQGAEAKQQEAHDLLDQRVQERTKDLEGANAALRSEVEERKRVEQKLRLAQFSVDHALDAVFWVKEDARIFYASDTACRSLEYSREELTSLTVHDFDPDFPKEGWPERWERFKQDKLVLAESRHRTKSGKVFPVELAINYFEFGGEAYCCAFARDITARRRDEEKLRQSEANHRALLHAIPDLIFQVNRDGSFLDFIPAENFAPIVAPEELLGKNMRELLPASVAERGMDCLRRALQTREPQLFEYQLEVRGDEGHYEARFVPFGLDEALIVIRDITEAKVARAALQESELRFRQLAETSDQIFWITTLNPDRVLYVSPAFEEILGVQAEDVCHDANLWAKAIHPEDQERVSNAFDLFAAGHQEVFNAEYRIIRPDGSVRWILDQGNLIRDDQGEIHRQSGVAQDITKRKAAEEALRQSEEQLRVITDALPVCIAYADSKQRYQFNNKTYEDWFGRSRAELKGLQIKEVAGASTYQAILPHIEAALSGQAVTYESTLSLGACPEFR